MAEKKFYLTEEHAIEVLTEAVHEVWSHKPTKIWIALKGSVDELPVLHVEYDSYAYSLVPLPEQWKGVGKES